MTRNYKLERAKKELNNNARKHLADVVVPITAPDAGADEAATVRNLMASVDGDHANLRNVYVGGGFFLVKQKELKDAADGIADRIESGAITKEQGVQELIDLAARPCGAVSIRGEGAGTGKRSIKAEERGRQAGAKQAIADVQAKARARVAAMTGKDRAAAAKLYEDTFGEKWTAPGNGQENNAA